MDWGRQPTETQVEFGYWLKVLTRLNTYGKIESYSHCIDKVILMQAILGLQNLRQGYRQD